MALGTHGIVRIIEEPNRVPLTKGGAYFNCIAEGKNPKKKGARFYYRVSIYVPADKLDEADEEIVKGACVEIKHGELDGNRSQNNVNLILNQVHTAWWDLDFLVAAPRAVLQ